MPFLTHLPQSLPSVFLQFVHSELTSFLGGTDAGRHDAREYDIRGRWRTDAGVGDAGGSSDGSGSDIEESRI